MKKKFSSNRFDLPTIESKWRSYRTGQKFAKNGRTCRRNLQYCFGRIIPFIHGRDLVTFLKDVRESANDSGIRIDSSFSFFDARFNAIFVIFREIAELRAQYRQLTRLLTPGERSGLGTDTLTQLFDDVRGIASLSKLWHNVVYIEYNR